MAHRRLGDWERGSGFVLGSIVVVLVPALKEEEGEDRISCYNLKERGR